MGANLCIENATDRPVAVHLEHISVRYWALIPANKRVLWNAENIHLDRGAYTLRAFDANSRSYRPPNMTKEKAKAIVGGVLMGAGGAATLAVSIPLFAVPGVALTVAGAAVVGGAAAVGVSAAVGVAATESREYKSGTKRGALIGKATKFVVKCKDQKQLEWEKVEYNVDDKNDDHTILAEEGERCITPQEFDNFIMELQGLTFQSPEAATKEEPEPSPPQCEYFRKCKQYLESIEGIELVRSILEPRYDKCFCEDCASERKDARVYEMGNPKKKFAVPWHFAKFGVKIPLSAQQQDIFNKYHVCYHGTDATHVFKIIECERLLKPGDKTPEGNLRKPGPGRFTESTAPEGHNVKQYFFSPTPAYSELYSEKKRFIDKETNKHYKASLILQTRIKPDSYTVGPSTIADRLRNGPGPIDPNFSDDELEWMTDRECVHFIYGVLIKLEEC